MKKLWVLVLLLAAVGAKATIIEGVTPSGKFKSVFVTEDGRLPIEITTSTLQRVIVDGGFVTVFPSTTTLTVSGQFSVSGAPAVCYPADDSRKQGLLCNNDLGANMFVGGAGVGVGTGLLVPPGACLGPDNPTAFTGALVCVSTTTLQGSYIYFK